MSDVQVNSTPGGQTVVVKQTFVQGHDNPFTADGELSHKADFILRHSTISRTELKIVDPDSPVPVEEEAEAVEEPLVQATAGGDTHAAPPKGQNGVDDSVSPKDVKVEENNTAAPEPADTKSKDGKKKCACCVVM